jgi:putative DNA primase/helicase
MKQYPKTDYKVKFIQDTTDKIIEALKNGTAPWVKPWNGQDLHKSAPFNGASGTKYRGINTINLYITSVMNGYTDPRWFTYNQAKELGGQVLKGQKSSLVQHWIFTEQRDKLDDNGNKIYEDGKTVKETVELERPKVIYHNVFNAEQIENIPKLDQNIRKLDQFEINKKAENILKNSGADITHSQENRAYYNSHADFIVLPQKENFKSEGAYYATALHELGHWTGHESRLDRDLANPFGSKAYAKEELRAEIGSFLMSSEYGIDYDPGQHMSYIDSWVEILEDKPNEIFKACADATKIVTYVNQFNINQELKQDQAIAEEETLETSKVQNLETPTLKKENLKEFFVEVQDSELARSLMSNNKENLENENYKIEQILYNKLTWALEDSNNITELENTIEDIKLYFAAIGKEFPINANNKEISNYLNNIICSNQEENIKQNNKGNEVNESNIANENTYLFVPYSEKEEAKKLGAKWDNNSKSWYAPAGVILDNFNRWRNEEIQNVNTSNTIVLKDINEIEDIFKKLNVEVPYPIEMDGSMYRISADGKTNGKKDIAYQIYNDTTTAGWVKDWRNGEKITFVVNNGINYSPEQLDRVLEQNKELSEKREIEREQLQIKTAAKLEEEYNNAKWAYDQHPYLKNKGLTKNYFTKQDDKGNLLIPLRDINGKLWTTQRIFRNGDKTNGVIRTPEEKEAGIEYMAKKQGCFFVVGAKNLSRTETIIVSEGFATAASVYEATNIPTVAAVDAGNLYHVVKDIREKYPNKEIVIAADNDISKEIDGKINVGKEKAFSVGEEFNTKVILPLFTSNEVDNGLSDFNDLANSRGLDEVKKQLSPILNKSIEKAQTKKNFKELGIKRERQQSRDMGVSR